MKLSEINYPVFKLGVIKPTEEDGIVFFNKLQKVDDEKYEEVRLILDNKNIEGTFAYRRIRLSVEGAKLYRLNTAIFFLSDLIKIAKPNIWFIDSSGQLFKYIKSKSVKLVFLEINKILPIKTGGAIIELKNHPARYKCLCTPDSACKYAGILEMGPNAYILYGLYKDKPKDSRRKV